MEDVFAVIFALKNWEPMYLNLMRHSVNVLIPSMNYTALIYTPPPILLDPVEDGNAGAIAVQVRHTIYVPPLFVSILILGELIPVYSCKRLRGDLVTSNLKVDC